MRGCADSNPADPADRFLVLGTLLLATLGLVPLGAAAAGSSASFRLIQDAQSGAGQQAISSRFSLSASASQDSVIGRADSTRFRLESGFWTSATITREARIDGAGSGAGVLDGGGVDCVFDGTTVTGDCAERAPHGTPIDIIATPSATSFFTGWTGCDVLQTATLPDDTCRLFVTRDLTAVAEFVAAAGLQGRVWLDYDGNGVIDAGEPGLSGAGLSLSASGAVVDATSSALDGGYGFSNVFPGSYEVRIDPATLPAGVVPSFDPDGTQTPLVTALTLVPGEQAGDVLFGLQPLADLVLSIEVESLSQTELMFVVTVDNLGPADATGVRVATTVDPPRMVSTSGCAEDPVGVPDCRLGDLAAGASTSFSLLARGQAGGSPIVTLTAAAEAVEADPDGANNTARVSGFVSFAIPVFDGWAVWLLAVLIGLAAIVMRGRSGGTLSARRG